MPSRPQETATSFSHTAIKLTTNAIAMAGQISTIGEMPLALTAITSLPTASRPNTLHAPNKIVAGTENRSASGST